MRRGGGNKLEKVVYMLGARENDIEYGQETGCENSKGTVTMTLEVIGDFRESRFWNLLEAEARLMELKDELRK